MTVPQVGIFAGTFDPVHEGHEALVLAAIDQLKLQKVYICPEQKPRSKTLVTDITARETMLNLVFGGNQKCQVRRTKSDYASMPEIHEQLGVQDAWLLIGTDVALTMKTWRNLSSLLANNCFAVGIRNPADSERIDTLMSHLGVPAHRYALISTEKASHSSSHARNRERAFHPKIAAFVRKHHLYGL